MFKKAALATTALTFFLLQPDPAAAGPLIGAIAGVFSAVISGSGIVNAVVSLALAAATTLWQMATAPDAPPPVGAKIQADVGDDKPVSTTIGQFATRGKRKYYGTWGNYDGDTPNTYFTEVIELGNLPLPGLDGIWIEGEKCTILWNEPDAVFGRGYPLKEFRDTEGTVHDYCWVKFYSGLQTVADPFLVETFGEDEDRPWDATMVGRGIPYAIMTYRWERDYFKGQPKVLFEPTPLPLYDIRKDSTNGGNGTHRWDDPSTHEPSYNLGVMTYNVLRGLRYKGEWFYGGQKVNARRLPSSNWIAACQEAGRLVERADKTTEPQWRGGYEISGDMVPLTVVEELRKAQNGRLTDQGGVFKMKNGIFGGAVFGFSDADTLITEPAGFDPFPSVDLTINGVTAKYPNPEEAWVAKDAPVVRNDAFEALDGKRNLADISFGATSHDRQVQQLMRAILAEARRFRRHQLPLPPMAYVLEAGIDVVSWTSPHNGYVNKRFLVTERRGQMGMNQIVTLQEIDPTDYDWARTMQEVVSSGWIGRIDVPKQPMTGWGARADVLTDPDGRSRRPVIIVSCATNLADVARVLVRVRLKATGVVVFESDQFPYGPTSSEWPLSGMWLLPATEYEVQGKLVPYSPRKTEDSAWISLTTANIGFSSADVLDGAIITSKIGNAAVSANKIMDAAVTGLKLADAAVSTAKLEVAAVTAQILADRAVITAKLADAAVSVSKIMDGAVIAAKIADAAIERDKLAAQAVDATKFASGIAPVGVISGTVVPTTKSQDVITVNGKLYRWNGSAYTASVPTVDLTGTIVGTQISDAAITAGKLADAAVTAAKFATGLRPVEVVSALPTTGNTAGRMAFLTTDGKVYRYTGTSWISTVDAADINGAIAEANIASLAASKITGQLTDAQIAAVAAAKVAGQLVGTQIADLAISNAKLAALAVDATKLADGSVIAGKIADAAVTTAKFAAGLRPIEIVSSLPTTGNTEGRIVFLTTDDKIYRFNGTAFVSTLAAGDITGTLLDAQLAALSASKVTGQLTDTQIAAVGAAKVTGTLVSSQIADAAITAAKFGTGLKPVETVASLPTSGNAAGRVVFLSTDSKIYRFDGAAWTSSVAAPDIGGTIADTQIAAIAAGKVTGQLTDAQIAAVAAAKVSGQLVGTQIADLAITNAKLAALAVDAAKLASNAVTNTKIADDAISTPKLQASAIVADKIAVNAITASKMSIAANAVGASLILDRFYGDPGYWSPNAPYVTFVSSTDAQVAAMRVSGAMKFNAALAAANAGPRIHGWIARGFPLTPDTWYRASAIVKNVGCNKNFNALVINDMSISASDGGVIASATDTGYQAAAGKTIEWRFKTDSSRTQTATPVPYMDTGTDAVGYWLISDIQLVEMAEASLIVDGAIVARHVSAAAITANAIAANAVTADAIAANAITAVKIAAGAIETAKLAAGAVTAGTIGANAVIAGKIATNAVTAGTISAGAVTAGTVAANAITAGTIAASAVSAANLAAGIITAEKLAVGKGVNWVSNSNAQADLTNWGIKFRSGGTWDFGKANNNYSPIDGCFYVLQSGARLDGAFVDVNPRSPFDNNYAMRWPVAQLSWLEASVYVFGHRSNGVQLYIECFNNGGNSLGFIMDAKPTNQNSDPGSQLSAYQRVWAKGQAPAGTTHVEIFLRCFGHSAANGTDSYTWFSRFYVGEATQYQSEPTPWSEGSITLITEGNIVTNAITANKIAAGAIVAGKIAANAVTANEIAANAITAAKIASGAIETAKLAAGAVTAGTIASGAITTAKLDALAVTADKLAVNSVVAGKIAAGVISATEIASGAITTAKLAASAVTANELAANAVVAGKIAADAIVANNIAANAISAKQLILTDFENFIPDGQFEQGALTSVWDANYPMYNGSGAGGANIWLWVGDAQTGRWSLVLENGTNGGSGGTISMNMVTKDFIPVTSGDWLAWDVSVRTTDGSSGFGFYYRILWFDRNKTALASPQYTDVQGNASIPAAWDKRSGKTQVPGSATYCKVQIYHHSPSTTRYLIIDRISLRKAEGAELVVDGSISTIHLAADSITTAKIAANAVTASEIAANAVTAGKISAGAVEAASIASGAVVAGKIAANAVTAGTVAANAITAGTIAANAVTTGTIAAGAVTAGQIAAGAVIADKIAAGSIYADKLAVGKGTNWIPNSNAQADITNWRIYASSANWSFLKRNDNFTPIDGAFQVLQEGAQNNGQFADLSPRNPADNNIPMRWPVAQGSWLEASVYVYGHRSDYARLHIEYVNNGGVTIGYTFADKPTHQNGDPGSQLASYERIWVKGQAPAGTTHVQLFLRCMGHSAAWGTNSYTWASKFYLGEATANQLEASPWSEGGTTVISEGNIVTNAITANKIAANAITAGKIAANAVTAGTIAANAVTAGTIAANAVTAATIAAGAVSTNQLAANAITAAKIAGGTITGDKIAVRTISADSFIAATITGYEINARTIGAGHIAVGTISATEIASNAITADKIQAFAISSDKIGANAVVAGKIAANAITADNIQAGVITGSKLQANTLGAREIAAGSITAKQLVISDFNNLVPDNQMTTTDAWVGTIPGWVVWGDHGLFQSYNGMAFTAGPWGSGGYTNCQSRSFPVKGGTAYRFTGAIYSNNNFNAMIRVLWLNASGNIASYVDYINTGNRGSGGTGTLAVNLVSPGEAASAVIELFVQRDTTGGNVYFGAVGCFERNGGDLIVDGALTAGMIAANAVTADKIAANAVTAEKISVANLSALNIKVTNIDITDATLNGEKLVNGAISNVYYNTSGGSVAKSATTTVLTRTLTLAPEERLVINAFWNLRGSMTGVNAEVFYAGDVQLKINSTVLDTIKVTGPAIDTYGCSSQSISGSFTNGGSAQNVTITLVFVMGSGGAMRTNNKDMGYFGSSAGMTNDGTSWTITRLKK
ncbi:hypothetical protein [Rhizobium sp. 9140]|uniref:hypothetical protein n=1 Tax=Rhizobium sp. 9140 TaxID=1761900 RepID=UPI00079BB510|nr:hypothetical protein [Rhizobium sp. 9140]CZT36408.1 hypothetical protein GA0004734_00034070 [Rhizobium sp. 9140]